MVWFPGSVSPGFVHSGRLARWEILDGRDRPSCPL